MFRLDSPQVTVKSIRSFSTRTRHIKKNTFLPVEPTSKKFVDEEEKKLISLNTLLDDAL
jgi:hypothetical protein